MELPLEKLGPEDGEEESRPICREELEGSREGGTEKDRRGHRWMDSSVSLLFLFEPL